MPIHRKGSLQYVITIAEEKSITKAAQKLYISQPSLSLSIQALEKETGIPLFERNRGEMKLTYAGSLFFKIGCFTFGGGWSILAQMEQEFVDKRKLIKKRNCWIWLQLESQFPEL